MKDKALRRAFKELSDGIGISVSFYSDGSISVWQNTGLIKTNSYLIKRLESRMNEHSILKKHADNKEPHICKVCNKEIKQK